MTAPISQAQRETPIGVVHHFLPTVVPLRAHQDVFFSSVHVVSKHRPTYSEGKSHLMPVSTLKSNTPPGLVALRGTALGSLPLLATLLAFFVTGPVSAADTWIVAKTTENRAVVERVAEYRESVRQRLQPFFVLAGVDYPPERLVLVGLKHEYRLEVYAGNTRDTMRYVRAYPVMGASAAPGPKLKEGDGQVPEGIYRITGLNPNSNFHLSLKVDYPNAFDRRMALREGRTNLGGDIYIHGGYRSDGCLAMGDDVAEELFVLAAETGLDNVELLISPVDFRRGHRVPSSADVPPWTQSLYGELHRSLAELPPAPLSSLPP